MAITAILIFVLTITLVIWRPRGLGVGWSATFGAVLAWAFGVISAGDIPTVWGIIWNATATFIAIIIISLVLDEAGFFEWAALHVARWGQGKGHRLFVLIILLGAVIAAFFNNDGAVLILTPIVLAILLTLGFSPAATLAFVMAAGFIADAASLPLVVSNLVNIVSSDFFGIGFVQYASVMVPVNFVSIVTTIVVLLCVFHRDIPRHYGVDQLKAPADAIRDRATFRAAWWVLIWLLVGFFFLEGPRLPVSALAALGAVVLLLVAGRSKTISTRKVMRDAPWNIVVFSLGMYLVVYGLRNVGLTDLIAAQLNVLAGQGVWTATMGTGLLAALLAATMNNLPTVLVGALSIEASQASGPIKEAMIYANVIGSDLGPKMTPIGSLATLLWLHVLARKGITITWGYYFRVGLVLTLPVLLFTLAALVVRLS